MPVNASPDVQGTRKVILVFVGAGGSAAVDAAQFPTTVEFYKRVPSNIRENEWFALASEFLSRDDSKQQIDIEKVLDRLNSIEDLCSKYLNTNEFLGWLLLSGRMGHIHRDLSLPDSSEIALTSALEDLRALRSKIHALVYEFYSYRYVSETSEGDKLAKWKHLFEKLIDSESSVQVFTTNYDNLLEQAIEGLGIDMEVATGRQSDGIQMFLDMSPWEYDDGQIWRSPLKITKLHGSVDWQQNNRRNLRGEDIQIVNGAFIGSPEVSLVLYPGHKGEPTQRPFVDFHNHLRRVAKEADAAIFVGYAFRDEYINEILSYLPACIPKFVIDKEQSPPDQPFLSDANHIGDGFTNESVFACIEDLKQRGSVS